MSEPFKEVTALGDPVVHEQLEGDNRLQVALIDTKISQGDNNLRL